MTDVWQRLHGLLEARSKGPIQDLLDYISQRHGEHEADELRDYMQSNRRADVQRYVALKYMDGRADKLADDLPADATKAQQSKPSGAPKDEPTAFARTSDKGSGPSEPIPQRPDRKADAGAQLMQPSRGGGHDVGTAGLGQKPQQYAMAKGAEPTSSKQQGAEPSTGVKKPDREGDFVGQVWQPSAYSAPEPKNPYTGEEGEVTVVRKAIERELSKPRPDLDQVKHLQAKLGILQRRQGGFKKVTTSRPNQAIGNYQRKGQEQNPSKPGQVYRREKDPEGGFNRVPWEQDHPGWVWAGKEQGGWLSPSQYAALVASKRVVPDERAGRSPAARRGVERLPFSQPDDE